MGKRIFIWGIGIIVLLVVLFFIFGSGRVSSFETVSNYEGEITIYKSGNCGCCAVYSSYFMNKGNSKIKVVNLEDLNSLKQRYEIPTALESCHTTIIGDYFVEGHIPLEAIEKLMQEKPDIKGIAMPGMPSGSPGMTGVKKGDFVIYAVDKNGSTKEWMRI